MNNLRVIKITILLVFYYVALLWVYKNLIAPKWAYMGFENNATEECIFLSILGIIITIYMYIKLDKSNKPSALIMNLFNLLFYIPSYTYVTFKAMVDGFFFFLILYQILIYIVYINWKIKFKPRFFRSKDIFLWLIGSILLINFFILVYYNGFKIKFDLDNVYENRLAAREINMPTILKYIKASAYYVGIITLMYALQTKKIALVVLVVLLQLMGFAFGASKTQFFTIFICFIAFYFYSDRFKLWAPIALLTLVLFSILESNLLGSTSINDIWTRRSIFMPAQISYQMYEFFETPGREFLYLRESIFKSFGLGDPYGKEEGFQRYIGLIYFGKDDVNANTGLLGNDYAQFGWGCLIIYPFLRVYLLKLLDYCAEGIDNRIMVVLCIFISFTYISGSFFSVLLTNALLLVNYLLYCFPVRNFKK